MLIDGKKIAGEILAELKAKPFGPSTRLGTGKLRAGQFFGAALVGDNSASLNFLRQKEQVAKELGIEFRLYRLDVGLSTDDLRQEIGRLARPKNCGGFIVQLPLPEGVNKHYALNAIPKEKDVDMLSESALGGFYTGRSATLPPSVATVEEILKRTDHLLRELKVILIGAGFLIGKPVGFWLQDKVAELTVFDSHIKDIRMRLREADVVISGAGQKDLFMADDLKNGALVIDFGFNQEGGKIFGDFNASSVSNRESMIRYTPTPGGTGPILVAKLFQNFFILNRTH